MKEIQLQKQYQEDKTNIVEEIEQRVEKINAFKKEIETIEEIYNDWGPTVGRMLPYQGKIIDHVELHIITNGDKYFEGDALQFLDEEDNFSIEKYTAALNKKIEQEEAFLGAIKEAQELATATTKSVEEKLIQSVKDYISSEPYGQIDRGEARNDADIIKLQDRLNLLLDKNLDTDGDLGTETRQAVEEFREKYMQEKEASKVRTPGN